MAEAKTKPAAKKAATKTSAESAAPKPKAPAAKRAAKPKAAPAAAQQAMSAEERYKMTEVAAYYIAQRNGFAGDPKAYWAEAEGQIAQMLSKSA
ncbi:DUF2934 domain-containing protein [Methylogaea oryzae]|uniref:DUF2934 domain-containing protein n=1 Tax=Methylogaea oryzae TaxID=1295382 RepID=A0A8D4VRB6_9GAMM|nr:DUF2934 domain-containing protein [Methylogaea oryzae]BBL70975.1 hypothetical protein MoryE10_15810 [Methylogaea oryzae]